VLYLQNYFRGVFLMNGLSQHPIISRFCRLYYIYGRKECVEILFPVTHCVAKFAEWSIDGVMQPMIFGSSEV
jgi:hypothetical protein